MLALADKVIDAVKSGAIKKGIYVKRSSGEMKKLPCGVKAGELPVFAEALHEFVAYLKAKPESRSIDYLAKKDHAIKCCYRCGYRYQGGDVCPKCGSKANR